MPWELVAYRDRERIVKAIPFEVYAAISKSRRFLGAQLAIEQRFDILIENYISFETDLANTLVAHTIRHHKIFSVDNDTPTRIDRQLTGLLASATGYKAQVLRHKRSMSIANAEALFRDMQSRSAQFAAAEVLRNHNQHSSLLVHGWELKASWTQGEAAPKKRQHSLEPYLNINELDPDGGKKSDFEVLRQLSDSAGRVALIPVMRKFIEDLASIHVAVRQVLAQDEEGARSAMSSARRIGVLSGAKEDGEMMAYELGCKGEIVSQQYIGKRMERALDSLKAKNVVPLINFSLVQFYL